MIPLAQLKISTTPKTCDKSDWPGRCDGGSLHI
jgi:hypothetical protein